METKIEITGVNLIELVKKVYELSSPQGLGMLHYQEGGLTDAEAETICKGGNNMFGRPDRIALDMDYIKGRACKFKVRKKEGKLYINNSWYDHTDNQLQQLLDHFNIKIKIMSKHSPACNCIECQAKRFLKNQ